MTQIAALMRGVSRESIAGEVGEGGAQALKDVVTEAVNETLTPLPARRANLARDPAYVTAVLHEGNARANEIANRTLATARAVMGMADSPSPGRIRRFRTSWPRPG